MRRTKFGRVKMLEEDNKPEEGRKEGMTKMTERKGRMSSNVITKQTTFTYVLYLITHWRNQQPSELYPTSLRVSR